MARRKPKKNASNYGKYSSDSAPAKERQSTSKASNDAKPKSSVSGGNNPKEAAYIEDNKSEPATMDKGTGNARGASNDPAWYSKDSQLVIDSASIPYVEPLGDPLVLLSPGEVIGSDGTNALMKSATSPVSESIPGIMSFATKATFGSNRYAQDPANVAANALYTHVRYVNSGRKNYDPADLFIYAASMADVYSFVMWCMRMYAKAFVYSQKNKFVGRALLEADRADFDNIITNLANFRYWLNTYINKVSSFAVPAEISYFQRRAWIYGHVYLENPDGNIKDQLYQFKPDGFYRFNLDSKGAGMLEYLKIGEILGHSNLLKVSDLQTIGEWLLEHVTGDEDFGLMSGDILKAFNGNIIGLASLPEEVEFIPVYDEYVLLQMKNATVVNVGRGTTRNWKYDAQSGVDFYLGNVYQMDNGNILSLEGVSANPSNGGGVNEVAICASKVLTLKSPLPTPVDNMEISRLCLGGYGILAKTGFEPIIKCSCGADVVTSVSIYRYDNDKVLSRDFVDANYHTPVWFTDNVNWLIGARWTQFKFAPIHYSYSYTGSGTSADPYIVDNLAVRTELDNYTVINWDIIARMHEVSLLSMLWVPGVAKVVNY